MYKYVVCLNDINNLDNPTVWGVFQVHDHIIKSAMEEEIRLQTSKLVDAPNTIYIAKLVMVLAFHIEASGKSVILVRSPKKLDVASASKAIAKMSYAKILAADITQYILDIRRGARAA